MVENLQRPTGENHLENSLTPQALLHALVLDGAGGARSLSVDELEHWSPEQGQLWIHLDYTEPSTQAWLRDRSDISAIYTESLLAENTRPRAFSLDKKSLCTVLRGVNLNVDANPEDMVSIRLHLGADRLISCRKRRLQSIGMLTDKLNHQVGATTLNELFIGLVDAMTDRIGEQVIGLDASLEDLEDQTPANTHLGPMRENLIALRHSFSRLRRHLGPQREALAQLQSEKIEFLTPSEKLEIREINDSLIRYIEDLDMMRERAASAQEDLLSQLSEQLNSRLYLLSIISAVFLPLGFLTGLMGVNLAGIPGSEAPYAFGLFTLSLGLMSLIVLWLLKQRRWF